VGRAIDDLEQRFILETVNHPKEFPACPQARWNDILFAKSLPLIRY
jgi:hypothetical protein